MREIIKQFPAGDGSLPFEVCMTGVSYCDGSYRIVRPHSGVCCCEYIVEGTGMVSCDGQWFSASAGEVYMLPIGHDHLYYSDDRQPWVKLWFNVRGEMAEQLPGIYGIGQVRVADGSGALPLFTEFIRQAHDPSVPFRCLMDRLALLFAQLVQLVAKNVRGKAPVQPDAARMKEFMDRNLERPVRMQEVADSICRSKSQAIRIFKEAFGVTPYEYLLARKMEQARQLLRDTNYMVKEIAWRLGFSDEHYFSSLFHKRTGKTPGQYRAHQE